MKKSLTIAAILLRALVGAAFAAEIAEIPWNESNIQTLRGFDKSSVDALINNLRGGDPMHAMVGGFGWYDLAGDHHYQLVVTEDLSGRAFFDYLAIYGQDSAGKPVVQQWIEGDGFGTDLSKVVRDLNGDGKHELIIPKLLISYNTAETFTWPAIYRLANGKCVEASRDFPTFYEKEVLPTLDKRISEVQTKTDAGSRPQYLVAVLTMERDKILRVLGRDPTAGLQEAYQWLNSDDPRLLQAAGATFQDIGGHEHEKRAASEAWLRALDRKKAASKGGS